MEIVPNTIWTLKFTSAELRMVIKALRNELDEESVSYARAMGDELFERKTKQTESMLKMNEKHLRNIDIDVKS